ncbi:hypothetical protein ACOACO_14040 [Nocardioides sp. CPCC 205120]|uniref:hypothetical protein n=1 Tax=Nocardioides sp. CPCC 205120 TaxID=3406462 RepID=UPI003B513A62
MRPVRRGRLGTVASAVAATVLLAACSGPGTPTGAPPGPPPVPAPLPAGLTAVVDQARSARVGREVFVRLLNDTGRRVRVTHAEITSPRFAPVTWTGERSFVNEADLAFALPPAGCGTGAEVGVRLTYDVDGGAPRVSTTTAHDRYGAFALLLDRDCAAGLLAAAADVSVGPPRVVGTGRGSVLELPVRVAPTGGGSDLVLGGFERTVLLAHASGSAAAGEVAVPLGAGDPPVDLLLRLVPARCDPHAVAEDKVGTLFATRLAGTGVPDVAPYLPLDDTTRGALRCFVGTHCGWGADGAATP